MDEKILICTFSYNRPDFIEIQCRTFKKFLQDIYDFIVFNDAPDENMANLIDETCHKLNIHTIRIPQEIHKKPYLKRWVGENYNDPAVRNCNVVQYSLDEVGFKHNGLVGLIDSDMFLIKPLCIKEYMKNYDILGYSQSAGQYQYLWIGLIFLNMNTMPNHNTINFNCGRIEDYPCDAGGHTYYYIRDNPNIRIKYISNVHTNIIKYNLNGREYQAEAHNIEFFMENTFLHYRSGSNWDHKTQEYHSEKTNILNNFINFILTD